MSDTGATENEVKFLPFNYEQKSTTHMTVDSDQIVVNAASNEYINVGGLQEQEAGQFVYLPSPIKSYFYGFTSGYNQGYLKAFQDISVAVKEMISLQENNDVSEMRSEIKELTSKVTSSVIDTKERLARIEENTKYISSSVDTIKKDIKDLPALKEKIDSLEQNAVWWKQYLLAPIETVVLGGLLLAIVKYVFHLI